MRSRKSLRSSVRAHNRYGPAHKEATTADIENESKANRRESFSLKSATNSSRHGTRLQPRKVAAADALQRAPLSVRDPEPRLSLRSSSGRSGARRPAGAPGLARPSALPPGAVQSPHGFLLHYRFARRRLNAARRRGELCAGLKDGTEPRQPNMGLSTPRLRFARVTPPDSAPGQGQSTPSPRRAAAPCEMRARQLCKVVRERRMRFATRLPRGSPGHRERRARRGAERRTSCGQKGNPPTLSLRPLHSRCCSRPSSAPSPGCETRPL